MIGIRTSLLLLSAVALPAPAAATDLCAAFGRIVAASRETPPFASAQRALANGEEVVPGFAAGDCDVTPGTRIACSHHGMGIEQFGDWPDPAACPGVEAAAEPSPRPLRRDWTRVYVASGLRFEYGIECMRCAGPATSLFSVTFEGRARSED